MVDDVDTDMDSYLHATSRDLFHANQRFIEIILVQAHNSIDNHFGKEGLLGVNQFRGHRGGGTFEQEVAELSRDPSC